MVVAVAVFVLIEGARGVEMLVGRFAELKEEAGRGVSVLSSCRFEQEGHFRANNHAQGSDSSHLHHRTPVTAGDL